MLFGSGGWRGVLGEEITFPRLRAALVGVAAWAIGQGRGRRVVVAHDTRFLGDRMAATAVAMLREQGLEPLVSAQPVPTPVAAHAVRRHDAVAGIVFTASHNPSEYHGLKVLGHWGGAIFGEDVRTIERRALRALAEAPQCEPARDFAKLDFIAGYTSDLLSTIDCRVLRGSSLHVAYDALHGSGAGIFETVLRRAGVEGSTRRCEADPRFGGISPDPVAENLRDLSSELRARPGLALGLATDGDADRLGAVDGDGRVLSETEVLAILVDHLARSGRLEGGVAISIATGSLVERVAASYGLAVSRHPGGFKNLSRALALGGNDLAGDESGGFAFSALGCDKDGILAGCLLAEACAASDAPLRERLGEFEDRHGRWVAGRMAQPAAPEVRIRLARLLAAPPSRIDGCAVRSIDVADGLYAQLDDGFVMLRASGTEPVLRIYAEAREPRLLQSRLAAGLDLLTG